MTSLTNKQKQNISSGNISFHELETFLNGWKIISQIGRGGTGIIYHVKNNKDGVLKINTRNNNSSNDKDRQQRFDIEINILNQLKSQKDLSVIKIIDNYQNYQNIENFQWYIVEKGEDIVTHLHKKLQTLSPTNFFIYILKNIIKLFKTLDYLHSRRIAHRDIKPENLVYINDSFSFIDFGIAKTNTNYSINITEHNDKDKLALGPKLTMPPEMEQEPAKSDPYKADIYSLTKTFYLLIKGYQNGDYCFKGQFNYEYHSYKDDLLNRCNPNKAIDFLSFSDHNIVFDFLHINTNDDPLKRMNTKDSILHLEYLLKSITEIPEWVSSNKDLRYLDEFDFNNELTTYINNLFGGHVDFLKISKKKFSKDDFLFLVFITISYY